jgi:hypothetical protein
MSVAVGRKVRASLGFGAACLLTAIPLFASEGAPVPRSTLVTRPDVPFRLVRGQWQGQPATLLAYTPSAGKALPVAAISESPERISVRRLPLPSGVEAAVEVAAWENLYVVALRLEGEGAYCYAEGEKRCDASISHGQLLHRIVEARQSARPRMAWQMVSISSTRTDAADADLVGVRVALAGKPLEGANIYFNRAPHSGCSAKSDAEGLATCRLVDQHGDDGDADEANAAVVATFSGDVSRERVLVPSTEIVRARATGPVAKASR